MGVTKLSVRKRLALRYTDLTIYCGNVLFGAICNVCIVEATVNETLPPETCHRKIFSGL